MYWVTFHGHPYYTNFQLSTTFCITTVSMDFQTGTISAWNLSLHISQHSFPLYDRCFCTSLIFCSLLGVAHLKDKNVSGFRCPTAPSFSQSSGRYSKMKNYLSDRVQQSTNSTIKFVFFIFNQCYHISQNTLKGLKSYTLKTTYPS
jgi:hypothetical protein